MTDQDRHHETPETPAGGSCDPSGTGCRPCGSGRLLLLLLAGLAVAYFVANRGSQAPAAPSAVNWLTDYDQALAAAAGQNQPVLLAFKASWCPPCREMDNQVFSQEAAAAALSDWVPVSVDFDKQRKVVREYDIRGVPTFVALAPNGQEIARTSGGMSLQDFAGFLAHARARLGTLAARAD